MIDTSPAAAPADHHVHFFETDEALSRVVADYLSAAILAGDAVVVVATESHRELFSAALAEVGVDVESAVRDGRLWLRDAAETLALFAPEGDLDPGRFEFEVGGLVREAAAGRRPVRVYGEMVALLWDAGDVTGAIELECLWNQLGERMAFGLLCAYPARFFADGAGAEGFAQVCHHHAQVVDGAPVPSDVEACRRFPSSVQTSRLARRFVGEILQGWGLEELTDAAMVVVTELATNAVLHAQSDVSVGMARMPDGVRLVVGDTSALPPASGAADALAVNGRGLRMVADLAEDCGHEFVKGGKLIWVELVTAGV